MDNDTLKLLGAGGGFTVLLGAFVWLVRTVGLSLVASLDKLGAKVDEHTAKDLEHHAEVKEAIVRVETKVDAMTDRRWDELTPVERSTPRPIAREATTYHQVRRRTEGEDR